MRANTAVESDAYEAALRAAFSAPHCERWPSLEPCVLGWTPSDRTLSRLMACVAAANTGVASATFSKHTPKESPH